VLGRLVFIVLLAAALAAAGCGSSTGSPEPADTQGQTTPAAAETAQAAEKATISLPAGWAMEDAISADQVGAITGETMAFFPEAGSAAQSGKPSCGYTVAGKDDSKIYFGADVQGGEAGFEDMKQFAEAGSIRDVSGVGDKAYVCSFSDGRQGIIVLKGDALLRVDWNPTVYDADARELGTRLAGKTLEGMFR